MNATLIDLVEALDGRTPVLHRVPHLPSHQVWWLDSMLPHVMVAPDVFERFQALILTAVGTFSCPVDEKPQRFSMPSSASDAGDSINYRCEYGGQCIHTQLRIAHEHVKQPTEELAQG